MINGCADKWATPDKMIKFYCEALISEAFYRQRHLSRSAAKHLSPKAFIAKRSEAFIAEGIYQKKLFSI